MKLSRIIARLEAMKESRWNLEIKNIIVHDDFDDVTLLYNPETDTFDESTLRFINWLPF